MAKYTHKAWLPAYCSVKVVLETDIEMTPEEIRENIIEQGEDQASLCHYCAHNLEYEQNSWDMEVIKVEEIEYTTEINGE